MIPYNIIDILNVVFFDYFIFTYAIIGVLTITIVVRKFKDIGLSRPLAVGIWIAFMMVSALLLGMTVSDFFSHPKGIDRLAHVPMMIAMSPLFICATIVAFMYPTTPRSVPTLD